MGVSVEENKQNGFINRVFGDVEFNRYAIMAHTLLIQSCSGSVAVYFIMHMEGAFSTFLLCLIAAITMGANSVAIAQGPMKLVVKLCILTVVTSVLIVLYALIAG